MGNTTYSSVSRTNSGRTAFYNSAPVNQIFEQNVKREIHESMDPKNANIREARDSEAHPNTIPIILGLDVTGSMGHVPHMLIKDGLPKMIGGIIQNGVPDPALLFLAIGDHESDRAPLQVGQFESGDEELDMWLTRTWLEGNGGGNFGESYPLAWYFAGHHTVHDAWEKRSKKGLLFTVGDEPYLPNLPNHALREIMGPGVQGNYKAEELLKKAEERYNVYHIHLNHHGEHPRYSDATWKELLGERCITTTDYTEIPNIISKIVIGGSIEESPSISVEEKPKEQEIL